MLAVMKTGGKQYIVKEGDVVNVEKLDAEKGATVSFETLLLAEDDGSKVEIGAPTLAAKVSAEVLEQGRAKKIDVVHYKAKVRYKKRSGHRQPFTKLKITKIG